MIDTLLQIVRHLPALVVFFGFVKLNEKLNCEKTDRHMHFFMPVLSLLYSILAMIFVNNICEGLLKLINSVPALLRTLLGWTPFGATAANAVEGLINAVNLKYWIFFIANIAILFAHTILKRIWLGIAKGTVKSDNRIMVALHDFFAPLFYEYDDENETWYLKVDFGEARIYAKVLYIFTVVLSIVLMTSVGMAYRNGRLAALFYPVISVILLGEWYFFLDGMLKSERPGSFEGEDDSSSKVSNYASLRQVLRRQFGDKLAADNTSVCSRTNEVGPEELLSSWEQESTPMQEAYAHFMRRYQKQGNEIDQNYLLSGEKLISGQSILFNDPFYYDLIPYAFYAMNRTLLQHKKVLIIVGRHGAEDDIKTWAEKGFETVNNLPYLWRAGIVGKDNPKEMEVGIVSRADVNNLTMHEKNAEFFKESGFVVLLEPSKLVTTAQLGLNSIIKQCRKGNNEITFCSADKNCDGLLDALSHILMVKLDEVAATNKHKGACSYMSWEVDAEHLQHRLIPNLTHYMGIGTELAFTALKNQISKAYWYGGDVFPVKDMHWIAKQYYYDLLTYANLPANQEMMDTAFIVSPNLWSADIVPSRFVIVEDEDFNMFELKRQFSTRVSEESFINMISPNYLLRDYMSENNSIFDADSKAIPYVVADYVRSIRNVVSRLIMRMSVGRVKLEEIASELELVGIKTNDPVKKLWDEFCSLNPFIIEQLKLAKAAELVEKDRRPEEGILDDDVLKNRIEHAASSVDLNKTPVIKHINEYSYEKSRIETLYFIDDNDFRRLFSSELQNASYIAEDENGELEFMGPELRAHVVQKYLPGQYFTMSGRYYEMTGFTLDGQILARRSSDFITGRPCYRQIRNYSFIKIEDSEEVAATRETLGMHITRQFADFTVDTPAYWNMAAYNDFRDGNKVIVSGIPQRRFYHKSILRIDFDDVPEKVVETITLLMNEVFVTLFSENKDFIVALTPGELDKPFTFFMDGTEECSVNPGSIYVIEDSQLDLGLLVAVERNINRIFTIICDYLDWHIAADEESRKEPESVIEKAPEFSISEEEAKAQEKEQRLGFLKKSKSLFAKIKEWFKSKFGKKNKAAKPKKDEEISIEDVVEEAPAEEIPEELTTEDVQAEEDVAEDNAAEENAIESNDLPEEAEEPVIETITEEAPEVETEEEEINDGSDNE